VYMPDIGAFIDFVVPFNKKANMQSNFGLVKMFLSSFVIRPLNMFGGSITHIPHSYCW
jgi:hypothetical protein